MATVFLSDAAKDAALAYVSGATRLSLTVGAPTGLTGGVLEGATVVAQENLLEEDFSAPTDAPTSGRILNLLPRSSMPIVQDGLPDHLVLDDGASNIFAVATLDPGHVTFGGVLDLAAVGIHVPDATSVSNPTPTPDPDPVAAPSAQVLADGAALDGATVTGPLSVQAVPDGIVDRVEWFIDGVLYRDDDLFATYDLTYNGEVPIGESFTGPAGNSHLLDDGSHTVTARTVFGAATTDNTATFTVDTAPVTPTPPPPSGTFDFATWEATLPTVSTVGQGSTQAPTGSGSFVSFVTTDQTGVTFDARNLSGAGAAVRTDAAGVTYTDCVFWGGADIVKLNDATALQNCVLAGHTANGDAANYDSATMAHMDGVQFRPLSSSGTSTTIRMCRVAANNTGSLTWAGASGGNHGYTASLNIERSAVIEDVYIEAGNIRSYQPLYLRGGSGATYTIRRLVIDRNVCLDSTPIRFGSGTISVWEDVYIRETDGTLTTVPNPAV